MRKVIRIREASKLLGVSKETLRRWDKNGKLPAIRKGKKKDSYRYYLIEALEEFSKNLDILKLAKKWIVDSDGFEPLSPYYCSDSYVFKTRLLKMQHDLEKLEKINNLFFSIIAITGEIGNNSFDHNLGNWKDYPGVFFAYDLIKKEIILADRGLGILKTLKRVKPKLKTHAKALKTAFTEIISGRMPEHRGNGLKYVKSEIVKNNMELFFQTGDAELKLDKNNFTIKKSKKNIKGCLAKIEF